MRLPEYGNEIGRPAFFYVRIHSFYVTIRSFLCQDTQWHARNKQENEIKKPSTPKKGFFIKWRQE